MPRLTALLAALVLASACGAGGTAARPPASPCAPLKVTVTRGSAPLVTDPSPAIQLAANSKPVGIAVAADGSAWVLETGTDRVDHLTSDGGLVQYQMPASDLGLQAALAPDGRLWFPEQFRDAVAGLKPDGTALECKLPSRGGNPFGIGVAADGSVWSSEFRGNRVARVEPGRSVKEFPLPDGPNRQPTEVVTTKDAVYVVEGTTGGLARFDLTGQMTEVPTVADASNIGLLPEADGSLWTADFGGGRLIHRTAAGTVTTISTGANSKPQVVVPLTGGAYAVTLSGSDQIALVRGGAVTTMFHTGGWPDHMALAPDGTLWWTEWEGGRVGHAKPRLG